MSIDFMDMVARKQFLGSEFFIWLWFHSEEDDGLFRLDGDNIELHFDDQLVLEADLAQAEQSRLKGGSPAYSPEAHKALQLGKRISKAKLRLVKDEREWVFSADSRSFMLSGVKIPAVLSSQEDDQFFERMYLMEELDRAWYGLFGAFLKLRLDDKAWEKELGDIRAWIVKPTADEMH